jgi:hypothetical protein
LKRPGKRSKLLAGNSTSTSKTILSGKQSTNSEIAQKVAANKQLKLSAQKKSTKKEAKQHAKQHQRSENSFSSSFEPSSKKFAIDSEAKEAPSFRALEFLSGHHLAKSSKEEVELHIKELSLLDLHSSEDDSSDRLARHRDG